MRHVGLIASVSMLAVTHFSAARAETLEIGTGDGVAVTDVVIEQTSPVTGQTVDVDVPVVDANQVGAEGDQPVLEDSQSVEIAIKDEDSCAVSLNVTMADGTQTQLRDVDVCGVDALIVEDMPVVVPANDPVPAP